MKNVESKTAAGADNNAPGADASYTARFAYTLALVILVGAGYIFRDQIAGIFLDADMKAPAGAAVSSSMATQAPKKIKYWHDPMDPTDISNKPGKSRMGMDYVPVYEEEGQTEGIIKIDPSVTRSIGLRTAVATLAPMASSLRTIGVVTYDETRLSKIQSKVQGWVEKLYVNSAGEKIGKGAILLELFSPDLVTTQEEFLLALDYHDSLRKEGGGPIAESGKELLEASRRRLRLFDVPEHQIEELEKTRQVKKTLHIHSAVSGVVIKKDVVEGMQVMPGETLYEVADLSRVWVNVNVYEAEIPQVSIGQVALLSLSAIPGKVFKGKITYIYPYIDPKSRTVTVRLEFGNPDMILKPDMYGQALIQTRSIRQAVTIPSQAVLRTGQRAIVFIDLGEGRFTAREVVNGMESEGMMEIVSGLKAGERVVTSAQFLLDSESKLRETISKMSTPTPAPVAPEPPASPAQKGQRAEEADGAGTDHSSMPGMDHSHMGH